MKVIIVGGSTAGMGVAAKLRRNLPDAEIVVYQKEKYVSLGACGLPYFVGGNFSDPEQMIARSIAAFEKNGVQIHASCPVTGVDFKNQKVIYLDDKGLEKTDHYDHLVIGVGAKPVVPPLLGMTGKNVFTLTRLEDGVALKKFLAQKEVKKVAVLGSGFIGLEMCEALGQLKKNVVLIEKENRVAPKVVDPEFSEKIEAELKKHKVQVLKNETVVEMVQDENQFVQKIKFQSGKTLAIDALVLGVGFFPATNFLQNSGLKLAPNGAVEINHFGQTNLKNVWSCGDCATTPHRLTKQNTYTALATVPRKFAKLIADNIAGKKKPYAGTLQTAILRVFDLEVARTGFTETEAQALNYSLETVFINDKNQTDYVPGQSDLSLKLVMDKKKKTLIGAEICGTNKGVMRIHALAAMVWNQTKVDLDLEQIDLPYAPPFARPVDIIHLALSKLNK